MKIVLPVICLVSLGLGPLAPAQLSSGPDVIVGEISGIMGHGTVGDITAFSVGTTSCNIGNQILPWYANNNQHPVIAQNLYRFSGGGFDMIGMSWLKHGFGTLNGTLCGNCPNPTNGTTLGVLCSDPYGAWTNGAQSTLGPRSEVTAPSGAFPYPYTSPPVDPVIGRRLQVHNADLDPAMNPGARYFAEGHYITASDALADNDLNNASFREVLINQANGSFLPVTTGPTHTLQPAIYGWQQCDPGADIQAVDVPSDGRLYVGFRLVLLNNGLYRWNFAVQNFNSDRSASSLSVPIPAGTTVSSVEFHDVEYHSGDGFAMGTDFDGTDWIPSITGTNVSWTIASNDSNANALRWGTMYSFRFETDQPPVGPFPVSIGIFRLGTPSSVTAVLTPQGVTTAHSGDGQTGLMGEMFPQPLVTRSLNPDGTPAVGVPVSFNVTLGDATLSTTNPVLTDAAGFAQTQVQAGSSQGGSVRVEATSASGDGNWNLYTRGLRVIHNASTDALSVAAIDTPYGSPSVPYILMTGNMMANPLVTPFGTLHLDITDPANTLIFCDGVGAFGFVSLPFYSCVGNPSLFHTYLGVSALAGQVMTFQGIGYNPGYSGWWITNEVTISF